MSNHAKIFQLALLVLFVSCNKIETRIDPIAPIGKMLNDILSLLNSVLKIFTSGFNIGDYILVECFRKINPTEFTQMYNDIWLKRYATSLIKRQWGENLIKFQGVTMLGGVTMNGETIFNNRIIIYIVNIIQ